MSGIIINVETTRSERALELGPDPKELAAPSNWVDDVKIKSKEAENRAKWEDRLPLDPRTGEVAGVGIAFQGKGAVAIVAPAETFLKGMGPLELPDGLVIDVLRFSNEHDLLFWMWARLDEFRKMAGTDPHPTAGAGVITGFGIREFGLPVLILRSIYCRVGNVGLTFDQLSKYRSWLETGVLDLQDYLRAARATERFGLTGWSLKRYAEYYELPVRPHGDPDEFPLYYGADNFAFCCKHIGHDLLTLRALLERIGETLVA